MVAGYEALAGIPTVDTAIAENYDRLAKLFDAKNFSTEAIAASRKAVELAPDAYRYCETLAKRFMENEDYEEALAEYTEAAKLAPNAFFAEQMENQRIEIYRRQGTLVAKIEALEAELEKNPTTIPDDPFSLQQAACQDVPQARQYHLRNRSPSKSESTATRRYNGQPLACGGLHAAGFAR